MQWCQLSATLWSRNSWQFRLEKNLRPNIISEVVIKSLKQPSKGEKIGRLCFFFLFVWCLGVVLKPKRNVQLTLAAPKTESTTESPALGLQIGFPLLPIFTSARLRPKIKTQTKKVARTEPMTKRKKKQRGSLWNFPLFSKSPIQA